MPSSAFIERLLLQFVHLLLQDNTWQDQQIRLIAGSQRNNKQIQNKHEKDSNNSINFNNQLGVPGLLSSEDTAKLPLVTTTDPVPTAFRSSLRRGTEKDSPPGAQLHPRPRVRPHTVKIQSCLSPNPTNHQPAKSPQQQDSSHTNLNPIPHRFAGILYCPRALPNR